MTSNNTPAPAGDNGGGGGEVEVLSQQTIDTFMPMLMLWPQEDGTAATDRIVAALLAATDLDGLNSPFKSDNTSSVADRKVVIVGGKLLPSRLDGPLKFFLRLEAYDYKTDADCSFTTSSLSIVAAATNALAREALPILAVAKRAAEPTLRGFYPFNLDVIAERTRRSTPKTAAAT